MASHALETGAPDRFGPAVIAGDILMSNILINVVGQFKKGRSVLAVDTSTT